MCYKIINNILFMARTLIVCVTGAVGKIAYSLYNTLCSSDVFGTDIEIVLRLIQVEAKVHQLEIVKMELQDCCYNRVKSIQIYSDHQQHQAFKDADVVIFLGSKPRQPGMDRWQVFENNAKIFQQHGKNLQLNAKKTCKCLVVSNPPNTNCLVLAHNAPSIPKENFTSLTRLDYNRFVHYVSQLFKCNHQYIKNLLIWGNHSKHHFCDINYLDVLGYTKQEVQQKIAKFDSREVQKLLHQRGGFIADKMGSGAHMSAAKSIIDHLRDWFMNKDKKISMGVILPKQVYGLPEGICFSVPVMCLGNGNFRIIQNLQLNQMQKARLAESKQQLQQQKQAVLNYLENGPSRIGKQ